MSRTKLIVLGAFFASLAVVFQLIPVLFSEAFVLMTMLSALPIYMIAKMDPKIGGVGYIAAAIFNTCPKYYDFYNRNTCLWFCNQHKCLYAGLLIISIFIGV